MMNESPSEMHTSINIVPWLQRKYMEVPSSVAVAVNDLYQSYCESLPEKQSALTKHQVGSFVRKVFPNIKIGCKKEGYVYEGLRINFIDNKDTEIDLSAIASKYGFFNMNGEGKSKYGLLTSYCVNKLQIMKVIEINEDKTWNLQVGGKAVDCNIIGLSNILCDSYDNISIIFRTVSLVRLCRGKPIMRQDTRKRFGYVQEWSTSGEESKDLRLTSRRCNVVLSLTAVSDTCHICHEQITKRSASDVPDDNAFLKEYFPGASDLMLTMLRQQSEVCKLDKDPRARRWDKDIIQVALTLWNRSPQGYTTLRESGILHLPSENLLSKYKNCVKQNPGISDEMLEWLHEESNRISSECRGGLIIDEMSIQEDLQMSFSGGEISVDGIVDLGTFSEDISLLNSHERQFKTASNILQFIYLSYEGFRFPIAYFPTCGVTSPDLYINVWEVICKLHEIDIAIDYVCFDGGSSNRGFQMMHFKDTEDAISRQFTVSNPYNLSEKVTFIMDYSHNIKKIRNNILSSGDHELSTRKLKLHNKDVTWKHWMDAYNWDRCHNPMRVHPKLTDNHIFLNKPAKMRNHLAEDVLNKDMLNLMTKFKDSKKEGEYLDSSIEVLTNTSDLIEIFRDTRPVADINDTRLKRLECIDKWLEDWNTSDEGTSKPEKVKSFLSKETYIDSRSMLQGFLAICEKRINIQNKSIVPARINSDIVENFFCQQRTTCHGSTTNPSAHQYKYGINATILGQTAVSKKSNATKKQKRQSVQPLAFSKKKRLQ